MNLNTNNNEEPLETQIELVQKKITLPVKILTWLEFVAREVEQDEGRIYGEEKREEGDGRNPENITIFIGPRPIVTDDHSYSEKVTTTFAS